MSEMFSLADATMKVIQDRRSIREYSTGSGIRSGSGSDT